MTQNKDTQGQDRRRVLFLTGIRSEYDILEPVIRATEAHPHLEAAIVVTGAHLSPAFGRTVSQIEADGFRISDRIESLLDSDTASGRARSAAIQLLGLTQTLERESPDFLVVCGDREEALTGAIAGAYANIPVAQIAAGDNAVGNVDDSVRHAVTKLAHLHLTLSSESADRVLALGEEPWRVHVTGNPGLDRLHGPPPLDRDALSALLQCDVTQGPLVLVLQHVISTESDQGVDQMRTTLEACVELGYTTLVGSPNSDSGGRALQALIAEFGGQHAMLHPYETLPRDAFTSLLKHADVLLGNSSLGILEAPFLKLPVVNVGNRQGGRQHANNIAFVPHERAAIVEAVKRCLYDSNHRAQIAASTNPFGDGRSGERIARILSEAPSTARLVWKQWTI